MCDLILSYFSFILDYPLIPVGCIAIVFIVRYHRFPPQPFKNVRAKRSDIAVSYLKDVSIWMATIQIAIITALTTLPKIGNIPIDKTLASNTIFYLGSALFCEAWILTGLPSISMRYCDSCGRDVLSAPIYGWIEEQKWLRFLTFEFFLTLQHWYWCIGLIFFAITMVNAL